ADWRTALQLPGIRAKHIFTHSQTAKFDLTVEVEDMEQGLTISLEYNTDLFNDGTMGRMLGHFQTLLEGIAANPDKRISDLPLLTGEERKQIASWNDTWTDYPRDKCVHELFEEQAERTPDAIALVFEDQKMTYRELNRRANQIAHHLRKSGVGPDVLVGIAVERSLEMVVGLLGILKAGGAFVPLESAYPKERLAFMLEDTQTPVLLAQDRLVDALPAYKAKVVRLDTSWDIFAAEPEHNPDNLSTALNLAYVMYTSGSTGRPKGTGIPHQGIARLVKNTNFGDLGPEQVFLQFSPISFDAATLEIWAPLLNGSRLVIFPPHTPSFEELGQTILNENVTFLWLTAGLFHKMVEKYPQGLQNVRQLFSGGDVVSPSHVKSMLKKIKDGRIINGYGPTENTTFTTTYPMTRPDRVGNTISIGKPIANTQVYILDPNLRPVPIGIVGELYTGGDGLARDYLNRPELTADRFIPNPFSNRPGERMYKTGDLARWLPDGNIDFLGRRDFQVKIRGFRIELGEIEANIGQHANVKANAVIARADESHPPDAPGSKRLVAYIVPHQEPPPSAGELRNFLVGVLPDYMVPSVFVFLDNLPPVAITRDSQP
ncbi:MAG: amino acid adenylation domain-containing protein, partial [Anaerolineales bacterium]